jgi:hypothetical protein
MDCFYCGKEILQGEGKIFPLDRPYVNIRVHKKTCFDAMYDEKYLQENYQRILEYAGKPVLSKDKTKRK